MKASDKKIKEPYKPEETPQPPQIKDPSSRDQGEIHSGKKDQRKHKEQNESAETGRRLGESPLEIDDETTI